MGNKRGTGRRRAKRGTPLWAKFMVGVGAVLMVVSIGAVAYAKSLLDKVNDIPQSCLLDDCQAHQPGEDIVGPLNIIMVGSDMRADWDSAQSDSIMIMHINAAHTGANIISIPRDLYVDIPDCGPGWNNNSCKNKINEAFSAGGRDMGKSVNNLSDTLEQLTDLKGFDDAAVINFDGFQSLVELFGGIELCVPFDMTLAHPEGTKVKKGCKEYTDTEVALGIVRERYSYDPTNPNWDPKYGVGDYGRQRMQQQFIKQLLKRAKAEGYMTDPLKISTLIEKIGDSLLLDLKGRQPTDFLYPMRNLDAGNITTLKVPSEPAMIGDTSYVVIQPGEQQKAADSLFQALREDKLDEWAAMNPDWVNNTG